MIIVSKYCFGIVPHVPHFKETIGLLFICLFVYLFICLFVYLFVYLFICLFVYLFIQTVNSGNIKKDQVRSNVIF